MLVALTATARAEHGHTTFTAGFDDQLVSLWIA